MNLEKSAVMRIVPSNRYKKADAKSFYSVPAVSTYKYLGLEIDACLRFDTELQKRQRLNKDLRKKEWIFRSARISQQQKYEIWQSLFKSKVSYAAEILCFESRRFADWLKTYCYNAYRSLLGIRTKTNKEQLLKTAVGYDWDCWLTEKLNTTRRKLQLKNQDNRICGCTHAKAHMHIDVSLPTPIKAAAKIGAFNLLKWQAHQFLSGFKSVPGAQKVQKRVKNLCACDGRQLINTAHIEFCRQHQKLREEILRKTGQSYGSIRKRIATCAIDKSCRAFNETVRTMEGIIKKHLFR